MKVTASDVVAWMDGNNNRQKLKRLEQDVREACQAVQAQLGENLVRAVYGRAEKQAKTDLQDKTFKAPEKIAKAMNAAGLTDVALIEDILGLTVVVHYADQIPLVSAHLEDELRRRRIYQTIQKEKRNNGYYATHLVFKSSHTAHRRLSCEVQLKTMIHDAWSAKTHDLIYKPEARNDARLDRLMTTFAEALQAIEIQSETLRDLIEERWASEREWRRLLREQMIECVPAWIDEEIKTPEGVALRDRLVQQRDRLLKLSEEDDEFQEIAALADDVCGASLREGYLLEAYFAVFNNRPSSKVRAEERALGWAAIAIAEFEANRAEAHDVWSVPLVLYNCGNLGLAIEVGEQLLQSSSKLPTRGREILAFNLADHLIEDAYFSLSMSEEERDSRCKRIQQLLDSAPTLRVEDPTPFYDAEGMTDVAFSTDPATLRGAIDKIYAGKKDVPQRDARVADAYFELHVRLAWRRLLEVETHRSRQVR